MAIAEVVNDEINEFTNVFIIFYIKFLSFVIKNYKVCTKWLIDGCAKSLENSFKDPKLNLNVVPLNLRKLWGGTKSLVGKDLDTRVENLYVILLQKIKSNQINLKNIRYDAKVFSII